MVRNIGICDALEKYIATRGSEHYDDICRDMLQYTREAISSALSTLLRDRRVYQYGIKPNTRYEIRQRTVEKNDAPKKYVPEIRPLRDSGLFNRWKLCARDPYDEQQHERVLVR